MYRTNILPEGTEMLYPADSTYLGETVGQNGSRRLGPAIARLVFEEIEVLREQADLLLLSDEATPRDCDLAEAKLWCAVNLKRALFEQAGGPFLVPPHRSRPE